MAKPATKKNEQLATIDFESDAGVGMETADESSFAIPFLNILQANSPVVVEEKVDGAKAGLFFNTVTEELSKELTIVPCAFQRRYLQWAPRDQGGGFKGSFTASQIEDMIAAGEAQRDGVAIFNKDGDQFKDTRQHYVLILTDAGPVQALMPMASTQVKRSKRWMSQISSFKMKNKDGGLFTPPMFARSYTITTERESNDQGTWYSFVIKPASVIEDAAIYGMARQFHEMVGAGDVKVDHNKMEDKPSDDGRF